MMYIILLKLAYLPSQQGVSTESKSWTLVTYGSKFLAEEMKIKDRRFSETNHFKKQSNQCGQEHAVGIYVPGQLGAWDSPRLVELRELLRGAAASGVVIPRCLGSEPGRFAGEGLVPFMMIDFGS